MSLVQLSQNEDLLTSRNQEKKIFFFLGKKKCCRENLPLPQLEHFFVFSFLLPLKLSGRFPRVPEMGPKSDTVEQSPLDYSMFFLC